MTQRSVVDTGVSEECVASIFVLFYPDDGARSSKTLENIYQSTRCHIPRHSSLHNHENRLLCYSCIDILSQSHQQLSKQVTQQCKSFVLEITLPITGFVSVWEFRAIVTKF
jgi:hypothetical protein